MRHGESITSFEAVQVGKAIRVLPAFIFPWKMTFCESLGAKNSNGSWGS
jgi:hypothetical protein